MRLKKVRLWFGIIVALLLFGISVLPGLISTLIGIYTDWLWFDSMGYLSVYRTRLGAEIGLFALSGLVALVFLGINWLFLPERIMHRRMTVIHPRSRFAFIGKKSLPAALMLGGVVIGLGMALSASSEWMEKSPSGRAAGSITVIAPASIDPGPMLLFLVGFDGSFFPSL